MKASTQTKVRENGAGVCVIMWKFTWLKKKKKKSLEGITQREPNDAKHESKKEGKEQ